MFTTKEFKLTDQEYELIELWSKTHDCTCRNKSCCGGEISVKFTPTTVGTFITAECVCGKKLNLDEIE